LTSSEDEGPLWRCGPAARWLPRSLAASILVSALLAADRIAPQIGRSGWSVFGPALVLLGGLLALGIVRQGGEIRRTVTLAGDTVVFRDRSRRFELPLDRVEALSWEPSFAVRRNWIPALALIDRDGSRWRIPAFVADGGRLIAELVQRSGRNDLEAWADALQLERRMSRPGRRLLIGYVSAAAVLAVGLLFYLR
jgi:hypothetical protein